MVVALLGNAFAVSTPSTETTPSGLKYRVPPIVVLRLKLASLQPGQTQLALRKTALFEQVVFAGHWTLISNSVLAWTSCPLTRVSSKVPRMNLGKTRTLPGSADLFDHAATGPATPILSNPSNKLRIDFMFNAPLSLGQLIRDRLLESGGRVGHIRRRDRVADVGQRVRVVPELNKGEAAGDAEFLGLDED